MKQKLWNDMLTQKEEVNLTIPNKCKNGKARNQNLQYLYNSGVTFYILWILLFLIVFTLILTKQYLITDIMNDVSGIKQIVNTSVISCYYNMPSSSVESQLLPRDISPQLCTHINLAFAQVKNKQIYLSDLQIKTLREVLLIKSKNPNLKILLSVGGQGNTDGFSDMVINHAARKEFIRSVKYTLRNYSLDGIDIDWEYPALHQNSREVDWSRVEESGKRERQHFSQLLREIRMEYIREKRNYLLTVALAAQKIIVDVAYDVDVINLYVDYVNIMTYDFHIYTQYTPFTGLNSPLYARPSEQFYMGTLNINYTVQMYLSKGLDEGKIVVGIPTYGHSFTLVNEKNSKIGSPVSGYGHVGGSGFVNYPEVCDFMRINNVTLIQEENAEVPYLYKQTEWISFDNPQSVTAKAEYIKKHNLRGAMIYALNSDDYKGSCGRTVTGNTSDNFPLVACIRNVILP